MVIDFVHANGLFQQTWNAFRIAGHPAYHCRGWVVPGLQPEDLPGFLERLVPALEAIRTEREDAVAAREERAQPLVADLAARAFLREPEDRPAQGR